MHKMKSIYVAPDFNAFLIRFDRFVEEKEGIFVRKVSEPKPT